MREQKVDLDRKLERKRQKQHKRQIERDKEDKYDDLPPRLREKLYKSTTPG